MKQYIEKVNTLIESFPYIKEFYGKTIVIKYGGHAMETLEGKRSFALDMVLLKYVGINPVIVHGGGPQINTLLEQVGVQSAFVGGMRVTDASTMEIVEMVLVGKVNKEIVNCINLAGGRAVGLSGKDGNLLIAEKIYHTANGEKKDIGQVGTITKVNPLIIETLDREKFIPVIAPIGCDNNGITYNINADIAAGKLAEALKAEKLILLTDVEGVKIDGKLISTLRKDEVDNLIISNKISGGMIPKVNCCLGALKEGVGKTHIIDGRVEHAVLLEIFTDAGIGTEIV
ncbi:MAG TPA: acetylglutamate kinase [Spirochaetota bacterium]|nr:acetylglutamate kinase [Spirochaetota bacterium]HOM88005.1 acetylglutamate kinase [Spirochaetota bacterium]HOR94169.1 acetylglutamate kinase [Spirochaetota bacterium]HOT19504.1 acetylglutamate kinase [Spirochaetota bacterium]HPD04445.1 acetylglutamate kinase [Spirochaetota bacterium]